MRRRLDIKAILKSPKLRRELMANVIIAVQSREGIKTTKAQALTAYDKVNYEK